MTTYNKDTLQFLIDSEMAAYAVAVQGRQIFLGNGAKPEFGEFNKYGAITQITSATTHGALVEMKAAVEAGASICVTVAPEISLTLSAFYVVKSPEEQAKDAKAISVEVTAQYEADVAKADAKQKAEQEAAVEAEVARRVAAKQQEDQEALIASVRAQMAAEQATTKPRTAKAAK
ncbi:MULTISPECIES: hypothetical protein [unclassified Pseudomonas]|uniref:hypothetical protein n=1 Tax=unclassified Pseudomonas TaxID=196821 RepID=UPI00224880CD|nr:hypothetical protein [Pseudomonas sp. DCB_BG]MCX2708359.1 hypothetical protein [Pseudomonas sp. DCB_BG]